jgi:hypothetical protein
MKHDWQRAFAVGKRDCLLSGLGAADEKELKDAARRVAAIRE